MAAIERLADVTCG